ncbi:hypothetical protein GHT09_017489 [Marmota monax]|uniref:Uncharacterized protein n=1 Tax=Marmota monax TaxID=9995 RepID=A0A834Q8L9_MARMO|nr:hypothetical protein GHT09_017489 [Marmota monax]
MEGAERRAAALAGSARFGGRGRPQTRRRGQQQQRSALRPGQRGFQRRRLDKARQKKEARAADRLEQELLQDTVKFGEVVLQPPELTAKPRRSETRDQPCQKSLMLRKLLIPSNVSQPLTISLARQRIMQEERDRAVQAYRALKQQQQKQSTLPPKLPSHTQRTLGAQP